MQRHSKTRSPIDIGSRTGSDVEPPQNPSVKGIREDQPYTFSLILAALPVLPRR